MSSAALVGTDGSVDWCCLPRFDSPSVFAAILDQDIGGRFRIRPSGAYTSTLQAYMQDTNVLETAFSTPTGVVSITDFMPISDSDMDGKPDTDPTDPPELHRIVTCSAGSVEIRCDYEPRHDYARTVPSFRVVRGNGNGTAVEAHGGRQSMMLLADVPVQVSDNGVSGVFTLSQGETATFVMAYGSGRSASMERYRSQEKLRLTQRYWQELVAGMHYQGLWREQVVRSFLLLHLMMYRGTGAIVAAPTTSLPETIGGSRNWDYRYSWLRDTSFTVDILYRLGDVYGADHFIQWLLEQCQLSKRRTRIVYGITQTSSLKEQVLDHLRGYEDSRPVRIGNGAAEAPADGRVRRGHRVDPLPAGAAQRDSGGGVGPRRLAGRDGHGQLAATGPRRVGGTGRAAALRVLKGAVLDGPGHGGVHCGGCGPAAAIPSMVPGRVRYQVAGP